MEIPELILTMPGQRPQAGEGGVTIRAAKAGDVAAFERIVRMHERQVLRTALGLVGRLEDAQDAAQEVFLRLHRYLSRLDDSRELAPWLYRVTVNVCRDLNRRKGETPLSIEALSGRSAVEPVATQENPEAALSRSEQNDVARRALRVLGPKERDALVLRDVEGLSSREVAEILGSSEATVRSQISSARLKMKKFAEQLLRRRS